MLTSHFTRWLSRPAEPAVLAWRPQVAAPALPVRRDPRPAAAVSAVQVAVVQTANGMAIRIKGEARAECAGVLLGGLQG
jgi:hypothetical protein